MSQNTGSVGKRTIASGAVIGAANIYGSTFPSFNKTWLYLLNTPPTKAWGSQIYRADDSPDFRRGNTVNVVLSGVALLLWIAQKSYYKYKNTQREKKWAMLDENERRAEELQAEKLGNRSITYRYST